MQGYFPAGPLTSRSSGSPAQDVAHDEGGLAFDAGGLPLLTEGWKRTFFLPVTGWAKDQDPNTISSRRVPPLPAEETRYDTREVPALITPLAPPRSLRQNQLAESRDL